MDHLENIKEDISEIKTDISDLKKAILGNGHLGLQTRVYLLWYFVWGITLALTIFLSAYVSNLFDGKPVQAEKMSNVQSKLPFLEIEGGEF